MIHESLKRRDVADAKQIGLRVRAARKSRGWALCDLAEAVGRTESCVACWECGARVPHTWAMLIRLCHALRRSADWLILGTPRRGTLWRTKPPERAGTARFAALKPGPSAVSRPRE
jgi:transcriptional regulator with XRE-family HTH domain